MTLLQITGILMVLVPIVGVTHQIVKLLGWDELWEFVVYMAITFGVAAWLTAGVMLILKAWP